MSDRPLAIEARGLTKRFGDLVAVDRVDLAVLQGELFGLLGPNGAGKTTLVRMLTALVRPTAGEALVAGVDVGRDPSGARRALGVVPQALTSDLDLTAYENMDIYARYFEVPRDERKRRVRELLDRVSLWDRRDDLVKTFSGGMRRRLEIARGLVHAPSVLFLDEPTIGLDPQSRHVIWDLLRELRRKDLTISLTTHYMDEAEALCDRVAIVDRGRIVAQGTPAELTSRLPGSDTIDLSLRSISEAELRSIRELPGVHDVARTAGGIRVRADRGAELLPRLLDLLRERRVPVGSASLSRVTLEDVFIRTTGRSMRDQPGDPREAARAAARRQA
jgi:ABC-2 type transport system ATP-binding protein